MPYKKFVITIPSYNNARWYEKNVLSAMGQDYPKEHFRVVYVNDKSNDGTGDLVKNLIDKHGWDNIKLINNEERLGALHNLYNMISDSDDHEVIANLDGDDIINPNALSKLNSTYQNENVWMTWGSYIDSGPKTRGCCKPYEREVINANSYNLVQWRCSHLRSFYAALFKKIKKEDLMYQGKFFNSAWDLSYMLRMLSLSAGRFAYIHDILYIYNNDNEISDYKVNAQEQAFFDRYIRSQKPYEKLDKLWL